MDLDYKALQDAAERRNKESQEAFNKFLQEIDAADREKSNNLHVTMAVGTDKAHQRKVAQMDRDAAEAAERAAAEVRERYAREDPQIREATPYYRGLRELAKNINK